MLGFFLKKCLGQVTFGVYIVVFFMFLVVGGVENRATAILITFCITASIILYVTPFQVVAVLLGVYILRHPRFRDPWPGAPWNLFERLPSQADRIL
jgi:hypothetical protein